MKEIMQTYGAMIIAALIGIILLSSFYGEGAYWRCICCAGGFG